MIFSKLIKSLGGNSQPQRKGGLETVTPEDVTLGFCVEPGVYESQAMVAISTLRRFGGALANAHVMVISPRGKKLPARTIQDFKKLNVEVVEKAVVPKRVKYGVYVKPYACRWMAERTKALWFIDSDTMITSDLQPLVDLLNQGNDFVLAPVKVKGNGSSGPDDPLDEEWLSAYNLIGTENRPFVPYKQPHGQIRAYWNSGVLVGKHNEIYEEFVRVIEKLTSSQHPWAKIFYTEQLAFALTMAKGGYRYTHDPGTNTSNAEVKKMAREDIRLIHFGNKHALFEHDSVEYLTKQGFLELPHGEELMEIWKDVHGRYGYPKFPAPNKKPKAQPRPARKPGQEDRPRYPFVVLTYPRCGSYYFVDLLNNFKGVLCHGEVLKQTRVELPKWHLKQLEVEDFCSQEAIDARDKDTLGFLARLGALNPYKSVGIKAFSTHHNVMKAIKRPDAKLIVLYREPLEIYASLLRARGSGQWTMRKKWLKEGETGETTVTRVNYDAESWGNFVDTYSFFLRRALKLCQENPQNSLVIGYHELSSKERLHEIGDLLGSAHKPEEFDVGRVKQYRGSLEETFLNLEEFKAHITKDVDMLRGLIEELNDFRHPASDAPAS